ncbi:hypothetical protein TSUD_19950 [Trifolium subterraneum]|uniref:Cobalamin-independent methionine synthase MetE C-terminal/archaeal domain-containing protein n=1 Tax=Trifolium subterraneum TaxID=3900 RepID=A0A2Z6ND74_TRISU|nr:hypothetical protein TSUD_19950 [Trifolium subterraneum]
MHVFSTNAKWVYESKFEFRRNRSRKTGFKKLKIHTHMCYSNFNDIIHCIIDMDAENSRSDEKLLSVFQERVKYGATAGIGPGVYNIHSPTEEIADRINKMHACSSGIDQKQSLRFSSSTQNKKLS